LNKNKNVKIIYKKMSNIRKKILFTFDLDFTILCKNTDWVIQDFIPRDIWNNLEKNRKSKDNNCHTTYMKEVYSQLKKQNISLHQLKESIDKIDLNPGFAELLSTIRNNKQNFDTLLISGSNTIFVQWILNKFNLHDLFPLYYTNYAVPNLEKIISINPAHNHDCESCEDSLCKRIIFRDHIHGYNLNLDNYSHVLYAGDGTNDYCLSTALRSQDIMFPRKDFPLYDKLFKDNYVKNLKCKTVVWNDGFEILDEVNKLI